MMLEEHVFSLHSYPSFFLPSSFLIQMKENLEQIEQQTSTGNGFKVT
jgi:hypothetical protein